MVELHRFHGPPGCGKTTALAQWARRACERFGGERVVLCSLTRAAAHELRGRDLPVPEENIGTLHALCWRALGRPPLVLEHLDDWNARHPRLALSAGARDAEDDLADGPRRESDGDALEQETAVRRARMTPEHLWRPDERGFSQRWRAWKDELGLVDFTDMLEMALDHDVAPPGHAEVVFYDEAQDGSALEHAIIRRWAESTAYTVVGGDGDQAIFRWRGGDPDVFLAPLPEGGGADHELTQSFRVPEAVRARAVRWISGCTRRHAVDYHARRADPRDKASPVVEGSVVDSELSMRSGGIADLVESELARCAGDPVNDTVFLLASCGYLLAPALQAMRDAGIPFHCPFRATQGAWNPMRGTRRLAALLSPAVPGDDGRRRMWTVLDLWAWVEQCRADGLVRRGMKSVLEGAARDARKARSAAPLTLEEVNAYLHGEPLRELGAALDGAARTGKLAPVLDWAARRVAPRHARGWAYARAVATRGGARALVERPRVVVGTCHATKGAEARSVILSPDVSAAGSRSWTAGGEARDDVFRTFYVGMTRARERLVVLRSDAGYPCAMPV